MPRPEPFLEDRSLRQQEWNYEQYYFDRREFINSILQGLLLLGVIVYLFYYSAAVYLLTLPLLYPWLRSRQKKKAEDRRQNMKLEFREGLNALKASVQAGYSVENAFGEAERDLSLLLGEEADICREFRYMKGQLKLNISVEELLWSFAERSGLADARSFAEVFSSAKRTKGDLYEVMERTAGMIGEKVDTEQEIRTILAAKRMEFIVMSMVPFGIIFYMRMSFGSFLDILYGSFAGRAVMTAGIIIYMAAFRMGRRITRIEVE